MIEAAIECLLFVAGEPTSLPDLARAAGCSEEEAMDAILRLQGELTDRGSGLQVLPIAGGWQLSTRIEHAEVIGRLLAKGAAKLSRAGLEALAIVAYRQPITAPEVEAVRGVSSDSVLKTLLDRRLIAEAGRKPSLGRPMLYRTTQDFLHYFGISSLSQLPELDMDAPVSVPAQTVTDGLRLIESTPEDSILQQGESDRSRAVEMEHQGESIHLDGSEG